MSKGKQKKDKKGGPNAKRMEKGKPRTVTPKKKRKNRRKK